MIRAVARVENPDESVVTIALTMRAGEWKELVALIPTAYPGWPVTSAIRQALQHFQEAHEGTAEIERP